MASEAQTEGQVAETNDQIIQENGSHVESDGSDTENSVTAEDNDVTSTLPVSGDLTSHVAANASTGGDYDPEALSSAVATPQEPQSVPIPVPKIVSQKPRTAGGFLVGDSDSEDEASTPGSHATAARQPPISQARSPLHHTASATAGDVTPTGAQLGTDVTNGNAQAGAGAAAAAVQPPPDPVTTWENMVNSDPRGSMDAWLALIAEYRRRNEYTQIKDIYERFLVVFPESASIWSQYIDFELDQNRISEAEALFQRTLTTLRNVKLFTTYLDYVRRKNDLSDPTGDARRIITQSFEFVLNSVGIDKESGPIWADYIQFIKTGPGQIGENGWEAKQKMDILRKTYQRAVSVPISNINTLWRDYDQFEQSIDKKLARQMLAQHSPDYMTAKGANTVMDTRFRGVVRQDTPRLPPAPGFEGDDTFMEQVELWKRWIEWEKSDPLEYKTEGQPAKLEQRILYIYKQALMALRFWPEMWVDAAEWCFENKVVENNRSAGEEFLRQGSEANPESVLLALKQADHAEAAPAQGDSTEARLARSAAIRAPYDKVLDTLYALGKSLKDQEKTELARIEAMTFEEPAVLPTIEEHDGEGDDGADKAERPVVLTKKQEQMGMIERAFAARGNVLSRTISFLWTALARAMRRVQGKGGDKERPGEPGMRGVFVEARKRGRITSDFYVAVAQMEWKLYKDPVCGKIFERGAKLFPEDDHFMLEYIKWLHSKDDATNAQVVFETSVNRMAAKPDTVGKTRSLFAYMHNYQSQYGELSQIAKLEARMAELFPSDPKLAGFSARFTSNSFDPIAARIIISPAAQLKPKMLIPPPGLRASVLNSPRASLAPLNSPRLQVGYVSSPKRPLPHDEAEEPPRKLQRGESPLKGAAGRRLGGVVVTQAAPVKLPREINFLLGQLPAVSDYNLTRLNAQSVNGLLRDTEIPDYASWKAKQNDANGSAGQPPRPTTVTHTRQVSSDYHQPYAPPPSAGMNGRPQSPYNSTPYGSVPPPMTSYRPSPLRPGSSGYDVPPQQPLQQVMYGQPPPPQWAPPPQSPITQYPMQPPPQMQPPPMPMGTPQYGGGGWQPPPQQVGYPPYGQPPMQQQPPPQGYPRYY